MLQNIFPVGARRGVAKGGLAELIIEILCLARISLLRVNRVGEWEKKIEKGKIGKEMEEK